MNILNELVKIECQKVKNSFKITITNKSTSDLIIETIKFMSGLNSKILFEKSYLYNDPVKYIKPNDLWSTEFTGSTDFSYETSDNIYLIFLESNIGEFKSITYVL